MGWSYKAIAEEIGCHRLTVRYHCDPEYRMRIKEKRASPTYKAHRKTYYRNYYTKNKEKIQAKHKKYRTEHAEEIAHYHHIWYLANKERILAQHKQWRENHREDIQRWRKEHAERLRKYFKRYYQSRKSHYKELRAAYRLKHLSEKLARDRRREALKRGSLVADELQDIAAIYKRARFDPDVRCYICGRRIPLGHRHVDHIVPLSRGGSHTISNLAIACDECNLRKGTKTLEEFLQTKVTEQT